MSLPAAARQSVDRVRAGAWAAGMTTLLAAAIVVGSRNLAHFDAALVGYTFATLFASFGITYRYAMWIERPPTRMYWRRGWQVFFAKRARFSNVAKLAQRATVDVAATASSSRARAARHHALVDHVGLPAGRGDHVPAGLGLGALRDRARAPRDVPDVRLRFPVQDFPVDSIVAFVIFHGLVWASFLVIAGVMLAFRRRMIDHGAAATQQFGAGHPAAAAALCDQRHRPDADGELHVDARLRLRLPRGASRDHGDRDPAVAAVRQALSRLPAARAARRRASTRTAGAAAQANCRRCGAHSRRR